MYDYFFMTRQNSFGSHYPTLGCVHISSRHVVLRHRSNILKATFDLSFCKLKMTVVLKCIFNSGCHLKQVLVGFITKSVLQDFTTFREVKKSYRYQVT